MARAASPGRPTAMRRVLRVAAVALLALFSSSPILSSCRSPDVGLLNDRLRPCPESPNCVSSQDADAGHAIEPLRFEGAPEAAFAALAALVAAQPRVEIVASDARWLHATFRTRWLRFTDDVEFLLDAEARCIHVRSASRVGYSDLGANRRRVEALRAQWDARR